MLCIFCTCCVISAILEEKWLNTAKEKKDMGAASKMSGRTNVLGSPKATRGRRYAFANVARDILL